MDELYKRIKEEIDKDPDKLGYATMTPEQIAATINTPITRMVPIVIPEPVAPPTERQETVNPPVRRIIDGLVGAPNAVSLVDVVKAMAPVKPVDRVLSV